jgi:hypothetical protein
MGHDRNRSQLSILCGVSSSNVSIAAATSLGSNARCVRRAQIRPPTNSNARTTISPIAIDRHAARYGYRIKSIVAQCAVLGAFELLRRGLVTVFAAA